MKKILVVTAALALGVTGCADSSDSSPPPATGPHLYQSDLANTVTLAIKRGTSDEELLEQLGVVAQRHGLSDWETREKTYVGIGAGLRKAGVPESRAQEIAEFVSDGDPARRALVMKEFTGSAAP